MFAPKISEFTATCIQQADGSRYINNPHANIHLLDHAGKTLEPGSNYLVIIHKIQSTPDVTIEPTPEGDDSEEHS